MFILYYEVLQEFKYVFSHKNKFVL